MIGGRTLGVAVACVVTVLACGSIAPSPAPAEVCAHMYDVFLARAQRCGGELGVDRTDYLDSCLLFFASPGIDGSTLGYDQCANEIARSACDYAPSCWPYGTLRGGAPCGGHWQCASGQCKQGDAPAKAFVCGVCSDPGLAQGESCADPKVRCGAWLWCDASKHCAKTVPRVKGEPCDRSAGTYCADGTRCANGVCSPLATLGETCTYVGCVDAYACVDGVCVEGPKEGDPCTRNDCGSHAYCSPQSNTCAKKKVVGHGEPCDPATTECVANNDCNGAVCIGPGPVKRGGACSTTNDCAALLACMGGTCRLWDPSSCK